MSTAVRFLAPLALADVEGPSFLLADERVLALHAALAPRGWPTLAIAGGESCKTFASLERVMRALAASRIERGGVLVALGGGSVCDLGGLAASLWMRGIALVLAPTTLLAMCDASVGGKTAINLDEGKNLVGTFWPAREVRIDVGLIATQSDEQFRSGLGEALKVAIGLDAELFAFLAARRAAVLAREPAALRHVVERAIAAKSAIVARDPREQDERRLLNLGHTLGHALEAHSGFTLAHGLAVARGIHWALDRAEQQDRIGASDARACRGLLAGYGFEPWPIPPMPELEPFLRLDKKGGAIVLPTAIGRSVVA